MTLEFQKVPRCYLLVGRASETTSLPAANQAFDVFLANQDRGLVLAHDHFVDRSGAFAVFFCKSTAELAAISAVADLPGWSLDIYPLHFSRDPLIWLFQLDFTTYIMRDVRLEELFNRYRESPAYKKLPQRKARGHLGPG